MLLVVFWIPSLIVSLLRLLNFGVLSPIFLKSSVKSSQKNINIRSIFWRLCFLNITQLNSSQNNIKHQKQGPVAASRGTWEEIPPSQRLCPPPPSEEKIAKIIHFQQIFRILPSQNRILSPRCLPQKKKKKKIWCHHWRRQGKSVRGGEVT